MLYEVITVQVIVYSKYPGQAPQVVEDQVTYPLTTAMLSVITSYSIHYTKLYEWEAENSTGNKFGKERVKEIISAFHHLTAEMLVLRIMEELKEFLQGRPQHDDATMMIIKTW